MADLFLIPYVRSVWQMLSRRFPDSGKIVLYGGGAHTRWLFEVTSGLPCPPITAIFDDHAQSGKSIAGIPLVTPSDFCVESVDLVLISSDQWEDKLAARARSVFGPDVEILRLYEGLPRGPYDKTDDRSEALSTLENQSSRLPRSPRQVVVVSDTPRSREAKICWALSRAGFETVLLCKRTPTFNAQPLVSELRMYEHEWQALRIASEFNPTAFHCMANSDYRTAELFVRHRPGLVIVDSYDLIAGMYTGEFLDAHSAVESEIERERFCLENADGLCCRSLEIEHLESKLGYRCPPRLFLRDGCWNRPAGAMARKDDAIHVAYAGGLTPEGASEDVFDVEGRRLWLAQAMHDQGVHFHLFPATSLRGTAFERAFESYRKLEQSGPYVHLHPTTPSDLLIEHLAAMDFGIFVYNEFIPEFGGSVYGEGGETRRLTNAKLKLCTSNKFYDYLDAGLPVIHNAVSGSHLASIVNNFGAGFEVTDIPLDAWEQQFRELDAGALRKGVANARKAYDVVRLGSKLADFYESLGGKAVAPSPNNKTEEFSYAGN